MTRFFRVSVDFAKKMKKLSLFAIAFLVCMTTAFGQGFSPNIIPYLNQAEEFDRLGKYAEAIDELGKALVVESNNPYLYLKRALYYKRTRNVEAAYSDIKTAVALAPNDIETLHSAATRYYEIGRRREAAEIIDVMIKAFPSNPLGYQHRAELRSKLKDYDGAVDDKIKAAELGPLGERFTTSNILRIVTEKLNNDLNTARFYERLTELLARRAEFAGKNLAQHVENNGDRENQADALIRKQTDTLTLKYKDALWVFSSHLFKVKNFYLGHNQPDKARQTVEQVARFESPLLRMDSCPAECLEIRAEYHRLKGRYREAIADLSKVMFGLTKATAYRYVSRGDLFLLTEQYSLAAWDFEQAIILDKNFEFTLREKIDFARQKAEEKQPK